jgi:pheromone shutdown protein TraB
MPPRLFKNAQISRDEYMADRLAADIEKSNKILAIVGSLHVIKTPIEWVLNGHTSIFLGLLLRKKSPDLKVFSICQVLSKLIVILTNR